jgi:amino acid transporter
VGLEKALTTRDIFVAGVGLVVAATTLVSDFVGWFTVGAAFAIALLLAFLINLLLGLSAAELATTYPRAGALYDYGVATLEGRAGLGLGLFLAFSFYVMFALAGAGETAAGAFGLQAIFNVEGSLTWWIIAMTVLAVLPNLFGIEVFARVELVVLFGMLSIRWLFGFAGFLGLGATGAWSAANWQGGPAIADVGTILAGGLTLAFWSFVGIEFVAPLAEETRNPRRALPYGIVLGLVVILLTSYLMGIGISGTQPLPAWGEAALGEAGCEGDCPQLAVGEAMFGGVGRGLMAVATFLATYTSMAVVFAAMPRILYGAARTGHFLGPLSRVFAYNHPRFRTPWVAILFTAVLYSAVAILSGSVVDLILSAAYAWIVIYVFYHVLVILSRFTNPRADRPIRLPLWLPVIGIVGTILGLYYAFLGAQGVYGPRSLIVFTTAAVLALASMAGRPYSGADVAAETATAQPPP